jgi:DNA-binding NarL/FixJ family response regulator
VIDTAPRAWTLDDQEIMSAIAQSVMSEIALRFAYDELHAANCELGREALEREHLLLALQYSHEMLRAAQQRATSTGSLVVGPDARSLELSHMAAFAELPQSAISNKRRALLTKRQQDVFDLLMRGLQTKDVARQLKLSHRTVEVHRAKILERLNVSSFAQLLQQLLTRPEPQ